MEKTIHEILEEYDLELDKIIKEINSIKAKLVLLQFPDGLKPYSTAVVDYLTEQTKNKVEFLIWIETCYGACDIPVLSQKLEKQIDFMVKNPGYGIVGTNYVNVSSNNHLAKKIKMPKTHLSPSTLKFTRNWAPLAFFSGEILGV